MSEELYIVINGERKQIDLEVPSGLTLNYKSNLFNNLDSFCASYSYTFKLPKTARNSKALDMVDDVRHESSVYGKRIECEYYRDGLMLFRNSYIYINECKDAYNAVMTWDVLDFLMEIKESGLSLRDIEKDFAGDQLTTASFFDGNYMISNDQHLGDSSVSAYYKCGADTIGCNPPVIPVRYLLERITRYFGRGSASDVFAFLSQYPITSGIIANSDRPFNIADDGAIPLISGKWSEPYRLSQSRKANKMMVQKAQNRLVIDNLGGDIGDTDKHDTVIDYGSNKQYILFGDISGKADFVKMYRHMGSASPQGAGWQIAENPSGMFAAISLADEKIPLKLKGRLVLDNWCTVQIIPFVRDTYNVYKPLTDDKGELKDYIELHTSSIEGNVYEVNFDTERGGVDISIEHKDLVEFWMIAIQSSVDIFAIEGYLNVIPMRENVTYDGNSIKQSGVVDIFFNLPDVKVIDLLKSLFYIENVFPCIYRDGSIGQKSYDDLYSNILLGNVYDWSDRLIGEASDDTIRYTTGNLGRSNKLCMKNDGSEVDESNPKRYDKTSASFETQNENIAETNTIFTFPFSSAALVTSMGYPAGGTNNFWEYDKDSLTYKASNGAEPIIGRLRRMREGSYEFVYDMLAFDTWQVATRDYQSTAMARILKRPYVISTKVDISTFDLYDLDITKPVYIERYNSYFAIISLVVDSSGTTKAELIRLPMVSEEQQTKELVVEIEGSPVVYKKSGRVVSCVWKAKAHKDDSRINRMVVYVDGELIADKDMERYTCGITCDYGTHIIDVTAYSVDGSEGHASYETRVEIPAVAATIDFVKIQSEYSISKSKPNNAVIEAAVFNTDESGRITLYVHKAGESSRIALASETGHVVSAVWEYYDMIASGILTKEYVFDVEFRSNTGTLIASTSRSVKVKVDDSIKKYYYGIVSGQYFQMEHQSHLYREGSYINDVFKYGDYDAYYMVIKGQILPMYVEIHFLCYGDNGATYLYIYKIDPYKGYVDNVNLAKTTYSKYKQIKVHAEAWYCDIRMTHFVSGDIWFYNS